MAQVVDCYSATAGGSSTMYYYTHADNTSAATRIYTGEPIYLRADYAEIMTNGMYRMKDPEGWIFWYHVQDIKPVYRTVTDACTPPTALSLDTQARVMTITGGGGGDLNTWTGFGVSFRSRAINSSTWGSWSADTVATTRSVSVSAGSGMVCQYRVRTLGSAGSSYYSAYTVCETLLNGNTAAGTPAILLPLSGMDTCAGCAAFKIDCPPEPDGDAMTLQRSLDGGAWTEVCSLTGSGGVAYDVLSVPVGTHTVSYRLMDSNGETGGVDSISFTRSAFSWKRAIETGGIIANAQISFVADIGEMLGFVNGLRAFYGLGEIRLPGTPGYLADWHRQLTAMQNAVDDCRRATGRAAYGFEAPTGWPKATRINQLRTALENT